LSVDVQSCSKTACKTNEDSALAERKISRDREVPLRFKGTGEGIRNYATRKAVFSPSIFKDAQMLPRVQSFETNFG
jgi:hypothetical protein